jgi:hypothetical protein
MSNEWGVWVSCFFFSSYLRGEGDHAKGVLFPPVVCEGLGGGKKKSKLTG